MHGPNVKSARLAASFTRRRLGVRSVGSLKGPYCAEFPVGTWVRIAERPALEAFQASWSFHNPLLAPQLEHAGQLAQVQAVGFQHGADELYTLAGLPGLWHEACLAPVAR